MISLILTIVGAIIILALVLWLLIWRRRPRSLKPDYFQTRWRDLQTDLKDKQKWPDALIAADKLLDQALKKKRLGGKNMGERLVKAQRVLTDNDGVWFGHKLRGQVEHDTGKKLKETDIKTALVGIRQALKDLGALPDTPGKKMPLPPKPAPKSSADERSKPVKSAKPGSRRPSKPSLRPPRKRGPRR